MKQSDENRIRFLVMDVDGTLTDGKVYMGNKGEVFKVFNIKDGSGIHEILPIYGIQPIIITARSSKIVLNRCEELNITEVYQGVREKFEKLNEIIDVWSGNDNRQYTLKNIAYIGDDIIDLQCMKPIKDEGGIIGCPANAANEIKKICCFVSSKAGGDGAVREFIEWLVKEKKTNI